MTNDANNTGAEPVAVNYERDEGLHVAARPGGEDGDV